MTAKKVLVPAAYLLSGFAIGAFIDPGMYSYGTENGAPYRVNRFTGVQQFTSSKGWVSRREAMIDVVNATYGGFQKGLETMARSK